MLVVHVRTENRKILLHVNNQFNIPTFHANFIQNVISFHFFSFSSSYFCVSLLKNRFHAVSASFSNCNYWQLYLSAFVVSTENETKLQTNEFFANRKKLFLQTSRVTKNVHSGRCLRLQCRIQRHETGRHHVTDDWLSGRVTSG